MQFYMFSVKIQQYLNSKIPLSTQDQKRFEGYITQYITSQKKNQYLKQKLPSNQQIITTHLRYLNDLKQYIQRLRPYFIRSNGNLSIFKRHFFQDQQQQQKIIHLAQNKL